MSIKYYRLAKGETPPEEFCAVRDMGGEPSEYVFYEPEADNAKLRELVADALLSTKDYVEKYGGPSNAFDASDWRIVHLKSRGRELGVEVD